MNRIVVVAGPTAVGKTEYAIQIAERFNGEIVSCDSMQLYRYMDIGSAKPTAEEQARAKHYLVDEIDPSQDFSVAVYQKMAIEYIDRILAEGKLPVIAGGTGLYLNSILYDMDFAGTTSDSRIREKYYRIAEVEGKEKVHSILCEKSPETGKRIHPNNLKKVVRALETIETEGEGIKDFSQLNRRSERYDPLMIGLDRNREELYDRINRRVDILMDMGLEDEVRSLMKMGFDSSDIAMKGIGYKEIIDALKGEYDMERAVELVKRNTRRYAKRQLTWFRRYEDMKWFNLSYESSEDVIKWIAENL